MSIFQFFRILWARKWLILAATVSSVAGGLLVMQLLPPRWEAHARVMLSILKPDPITGQVLSGVSSRTYVDTQTELIKDYSVAGQVPEQIGWLSDPDLIARYQRGAKRSGQDFRHWAAQLIIDRTRPALLEGSNILEITYTTNNPSEAKTVVDYIRQDYINTSLSMRRNEALRNAEWYQDQAQKIRVSLEASQSVLANYERENGVFMTDSKEDVDSAQLRIMAAQAAQAPAAAAAAAGGATFASQLAELDSQISLEAQRLGPNHPDLQALRTRRQALAQLAAKERTGQASAAGAAAANAGAMQRAVQAQKDRLISKSDKIGRLRQLQADVDLKQEQYNKALSRAGELAQEGAAADSGLTVLGPAMVGSAPVFPKKPLILGGSFVLGFGAGVLAALLAELLARRVRSTEDLQDAIDAPVLAVVPAEKLRRPKPSHAAAIKASKRSLAQA